MSEMRCKHCGANEDRINGFCSVECEEYYSLEEEINALDNVILERGAEIGRLNARIVELEAENERLSQLLHDEMSQLEIATDLGNKRWIALNEIYEKSEKHSAWWCKRKAQEGLGIK